MDLQPSSDKVRPSKRLAMFLVLVVTVKTAMDHLCLWLVVRRRNSEFLRRTGQCHALARHALLGFSTSSSLAKLLSQLVCMLRTTSNPFYEMVYREMMPSTRKSVYSVLSFANRPKHHVCSIKNEHTIESWEQQNGMRASPENYMSFIVCLVSLNKCCLRRGHKKPRIVQILLTWTKKIHLSII